MRRLLVPFYLSPHAPPVGAALHHLSGLTMGTTWSAKLAVPATCCLGSLQAGIQAQLDKVVAQMSTWEIDSDLSRYNRAEPGSWHVLPPEFFRVLKFALSVAEASEGAYDSTAGPLVNVWGFGPQPATAQRPEPAALEAARARVGWRQVQLDPATQSALQPGGVYLDLSAIAKGFGVDQVARYLQGIGCDHYLVEVGGELRGGGIKPDALPWWVALERPPSFLQTEEAAMEWVIALHGLSVATSGDYRRYFITESGTSHARRYNHTIDPRSGEPIQHGLASVTVIHAECMAADALSTALNVMGVERGMAFAQKHALAALFVTRTETGLVEHPSPAFTTLLQ